MTTPTASSPVTLREITDTNRADIIAFSVQPHQDGLVAPNSRSLAQASEHAYAWCRAIYADDTPVGFAMLEDWSLAKDAEPELYHGEPFVGLWRLMIDARYQGNGFGKRAMELLIAHAKTRPGVTNMVLSYVPKSGNPEGFYKKFDFARTGEDVDGEIVMIRGLG